MRYFDDNLPDLLLGVHEDLVRDVVRVQLHNDFDVFLRVVLGHVLHGDVHVVEAEEVGADHLDPVLAHGHVLGVPLPDLVQLLGHLLHFLQEVLHEHAFVLLIDLALQVDVHQEVAALGGDD